MKTNPWHKIRHLHRQYICGKASMRIMPHIMTHTSILLRKLCIQNNVKSLFHIFSVVFAATKITNLPVFKSCLFLLDLHKLLSAVAWTRKNKKYGCRFHSHFRKYTLFVKKYFQKFIHHTVHTLNYIIIMFLLLLDCFKNLHPADQRLSICMLITNSYNISFYRCSGASNIQDSWCCTCFQTRYCKSKY